MANVANPRNTPASLGGKRLQDHKLVFDPPNVVHSSEQRSPPADATQGTTHRTEGRGSTQSTTEEVENEDDEEDSSGGQEDEQEDAEDEPEALAPSRGYGKGKGKHPAIRIESAGEDESEKEDDETASREAGRHTSKLPVNRLLSDNKKRTFSNVSNTSLLFGEDDAGLHTFPRPKVPRTLSHSGGSGLLTYKATNHAGGSGYENAIESSDEDRDLAEDDDDDEDYSGLNQISDDDSDIERVEAQEECFIINDEQQHATSLFSNDFNDARRLSLESYGSGDIFDFTPDDAYFAPATTQDIGFGQFFEPEPLPTSPEPMAKRKFSDSSAKRVRFDDEVQVSDSSSSSSSELDNALFPDLFMDQDKLPPSLYQLMEADSESENEDFSSSASDHSYWDVGQNEIHSIAPRDSDNFDESSEAGSSGYETDMGDTTDEYDSDLETVAAPQTPRQRSVLHRPSSAPGSKAASPKPFQRSAIGPTRGIFIHEDSRQAIAVTNRTTKTLTFYRPRASISLREPNYAAYSSSGSTANNSPRTSLQQFNASDGNDVFSNPFMSSTDIMLTGIFGSAPADAYLFGGDSVGPPEAFYPFISIGQNGNIMTDEDDYDDDVDFENDVNLTDFMDFGSDAVATDVEQEDETDVPATPATSMIAFSGSTPAQPTPMADTPLKPGRNRSDAMLEHFDRAGVTAFRNNQNRFRDMACLPHDPNLRASVSRPIRSGRSAETLMSPLRKRSSMAKKHGSSPFAGVSKATGRLQSSVLNGRRGPFMGNFS